jgi:hypothetical protein
MSKKEKEKEQNLKENRKSVHAKFVGALVADELAEKVRTDHKEKMSLVQVASEISAALSGAKPKIKPKAEEEPKAEPVVTQPKVKETPEGKTCCKCKSFSSVMDVCIGRPIGYCHLHKRCTARKNSCKKWEGR